MAALHRMCSTNQAVKGHGRHAGQQHRQGLAQQFITPVTGQLFGKAATQIGKSVELPQGLAPVGQYLASLVQTSAFETRCIGRHKALKLFRFCTELIQGMRGHGQVAAELIAVLGGMVLNLVQAGMQRGESRESTWCLMGWMCGMCGM